MTFELACTVSLELMHTIPISSVMGNQYSTLLVLNFVSL
jgi:hypothetical protein